MTLVTAQDDVLASLHAKLEAFESGLTEEERAAFLAVVVLAGAELLSDPEVSGFQTAGPTSGSPLPSSFFETAPSQFTSVSNVLKLRHDTVKNSMSNVR